MSEYNTDVDEEFFTNIPMREMGVALKNTPNLIAPQRGLRVERPVDTENMFAKCIGEVSMKLAPRIEIEK